MCGHRRVGRVPRSGRGRVVDKGDKRYPRIFIYIPSKVATDSAFPFGVGEHVLVKIEGDRLIIEKYEKAAE